MTIEIILPDEQKHYYADAEINSFGDASEIGAELREMFKEAERETWEAWATDGDIYADLMNFVAEYVIDRRGDILERYFETWDGKREYREKKKEILDSQRRAIKRYKEFDEFGYYRGKK